MNGLHHPVDQGTKPEGWTGATRLERQLLGALLRDNSVYQRVKDLVDGADFGTAIGSRVFDAIERLIRAGKPADPTAVASDLGIYQWDISEGAGRYLTDLLSEVAPTERAEQIAQHIREAAEIRRRNTPLYHDDIVAWAHRQSDLLAQLAERNDGVAPQVDWENVIEEILSVGRSQVKGVARKIELILAHLLKVISDPRAPSRDKWHTEIDVWRMALSSEYTASMRRLLDLQALWVRAQGDASADLDEYGLKLARSIPQQCPFAIDDLINDKRPLEDILKQLAAAMAAART